jgi:hypothetical protein
MVGTDGSRKPNLCHRRADWSSSLDADNPDEVIDRIPSQELPVCPAAKGRQP